MTSKIAAVLVFLALSARSVTAHVPTIDELVSLTSPGEVALSPDGLTLAYVVTESGVDAKQKLTGADRRYYAMERFVAKGALVLMVNYRGSAGYGEAFRSLNVRNLGVGDAWDVESGLDHLVRQGIVDETRVGTMGWSQGGYISAFLATHSSHRFRAASVGAGISDWMTYYVNTDIHPFTRQYLRPIRGAIPRSTRIPPPSPTSGGREPRR